MSVLDAISPPEGWSWEPVCGVATRMREDRHAHLQLLSVFLGDGVIPRSSRDDNHNQIGADLGKYQRVQPGDIVFNKLRTWQGGFGVSAYEGIVSPAYIVIRPSSMLVEPKFLHHLLRSDPYLAELTRLSKWMPPSQFDIGWESIKRLPLLLPPIRQQRHIAEFLDDQVARIDQVIALRQRQAELLSARWQRAVQSATTHGGEGWVSRRVASVFATGSGTTPSSDQPRYFDGPIPWVNSGDLNDAVVVTTAKSVTVEALRDYSSLKVHPRGSLMVAMYGATVGKTGLLGVDACVNQAVCVLSERGPVSSVYARYWFFGQREEILLLAAGGGQPNISQETVRDQRIAAPSRADQDRIVKHLDLLAQQQHGLADTLQTSIALLQERKRSLITAVVTGQLDVSTMSSRAATIAVG